MEPNGTWQIRFEGEAVCGKVRMPGEGSGGCGTREDRRAPGSHPCWAAETGGTSGKAEGQLWVKAASSPILPASHVRLRVQGSHLAG